MTLIDGAPQACHFDVLAKKKDFDFCCDNKYTLSICHEADEVANPPPPPALHHHHSVDATNQVRDNLPLFQDTFCWCFWDDTRDIDYYETMSCCSGDGTYGDYNVSTSYTFWSLDLPWNMALIDGAH